MLPSLTSLDVRSFSDCFLWDAMCGSVLSCSVVSDSLRPMDCGPPGSSVHGDSPGKNTGVGHALLQEIFSTQRWNPGLLHCRRILCHLCHLSHQGNPHPKKKKVKRRKHFKIQFQYTEYTKALTVVYGTNSFLSIPQPLQKA